jgi:tripartite-type tricarboxylate transporter receptor subunit TctC
VQRFGASALTAAMLLGLGFGPAPGAHAQSNYPTRPIRLLVGFAAGTAPDVGARILADKLAEALGKSVVVENVLGASGNVAGERVARSEPDGYTLALAANSAVVINPSLFPQMSYDPVTELAPITQVFGYANILTVNKDVPVTNVRELVELARARPGTLTIGHAGAGTTLHLCAELFRSMANIDLQFVPYRGGVNLLSDLLGGQITMYFSTPPTILPLARDQRVKVLAVSSLQHIAAAPDLPTMAESGFPGFDVTVWFGLMAPARTPTTIIGKLNREAVRILALPEIRRRFDDIGTEAIGNSSAEFSAAIASEAPRWAKFINQTGIRMD